MQKKNSFKKSHSGLFFLIFFSSLFLSLVGFDLRNALLLYRYFCLKKQNKKVCKPLGIFFFYLHFVCVCVCHWVCCIQGSLIQFFCCYTTSVLMLPIPNLMEFHHLFVHLFLRKHQFSIYDLLLCSYACAAIVIDEDNWLVSTELQKLELFFPLNFVSWSKQMIIVWPLQPC